MEKSSVLATLPQQFRLIPVFELHLALLSKFYRPNQKSFGFNIVLRLSFVKRVLSIHVFVSRVNSILNKDLAHFYPSYGSCLHQRRHSVLISNV